MIPGFSAQKKLAEQRPLKQFSPQVAGKSNKLQSAAILNEGKVRVQEERLAQYGLLAKNGSFSTLPVSRHAAVPVSMDS